MKPKIIFDTDIGCDCDDAAALALALELANAGECEILAVTHCTVNEAAAGCIEAILSYYGHPEVPVGSFHREDKFPTIDWHDVYASDVALRYETGYQKGNRYDDTVAVLRQALSGAEDSSVTIVATGALTSLARLLDSGPSAVEKTGGRAPSADENPGGGAPSADGNPGGGVLPDGGELIRRKVRRTVCMAGRFTEQWPEPVIVGDGFAVEKEWNVLCDVDAARKVCEEWPGELVFCSYEIGLPIITCGGLQKNGPKDNPVRTCYEVWSEKDGCGAVGRESWDGVTMLYAIRPDSGYWKLHPYGSIHVDQDGKTSWTEQNGGRQTFLTENLPYREVERIINEILDRDIRRGQKRT